jgi:hypothetical protein
VVHITLETPRRYPFVFATDEQFICSYGPELRTMLLSPMFDLTSLTVPLLTVDLFYDCTVNDDGLLIQTSSDGMTWSVLGSMTSAPSAHWYNAFPVTALSAPWVLGQPGLAAPAWSGISGAWLTASIPLPTTSRMQLRFAFGSGVFGVSALASISYVMLM